MFHPTTANGQCSHVEIFGDGVCLRVRPGLEILTRMLPSDGARAALLLNCVIAIVLKLGLSQE